MKKNTFIWVISLMSLALIGLIFFQVYWINEAVRLGEDRFNQDIHDVPKGFPKPEEDEIVDKTFEFFLAQKEEFKLNRRLYYCLRRKAYQTT